MKRLIILAVVIFALSLTPLSAAHGNATQSGDVLIVPITDAREVIADNAALLAEVEATNKALEAERMTTDELLTKCQQLIEATHAQAKAYEAQLASERRREVIKIIGALIIGGVIGAAVH